MSTYLEIDKKYENESTLFFNNEQRRLKLIIETMILPEQELCKSPIKCKLTDPNCKICKFKGEYSCNNAAFFGHLDCLKYAHENGSTWNENTCRYSATHGHLECLKYAHENGCPWDEFTSSSAIKNNHTECLKYARENGCPQ